MSLRAYVKRNFPRFYSCYGICKELRNANIKGKSDAKVVWQKIKINEFGMLCGGEGGDVLDVTLNFYISCLLQKKFRTFIEVGSYSGRRLFLLKRHFPEVSFYGLDINEAYIEPKNIDGVEFRFFENSFFNSSYDAPVLATRGTLACMDSSQIFDFLSLVSSKKIPVIFSEPYPLFGIDRSVQRSVTSYYHPYDNLFKMVGYAPLSKRKTYTRMFSYSTAESLYLNIMFPT